MVSVAANDAAARAARVVAGVDLLLLQFSPQLEEMERFAETVIPLVEGAAAGTIRRPYQDRRSGREIS